MNSGDPLLSIVIPSRNRAAYSKSTIQSILSIRSPNLQLVVEDNSDSDQLATWVKETIDDSRLVFSHSLIPVSMVKNYDRAVLRATGEYVSLIGDDDCVNPEILDAAIWARNNQIDAVTPTTPAHYVWPDLHLRSSASISAGELRVSPFTGEVSFPDPESEMRKCVRDAGLNFHALPKAYYGIIRRECLLRIREKTGTYFPGPSPDMAVALAAANYVGRMCRVDYPLFLPGSSARSNAGLSGMGKHIGRLRDQPHLPTTCEEDWSEVVPLFYSVETMWAESAVSALESIGRNDLLSEFNVSRLYAECAMWHPEYLRVIAKGFFPALRATKQGVVRGTLRLLSHFLYLTWLRFRALISRFGRSAPPQISAFGVTGLANIAEAVEALSRHLEQSGKRFHEAIL
jgi:glycosyltransferase involved in cell wall biosynthesis